MKYASIKELAAHGSKKEIAHQLLQLNEVSNRFEEFLKERLGEEEFAEVLRDWTRHLSGRFEPESSHE